MVTAYVLGGVILSIVEGEELHDQVRECMRQKNLDGMFGAIRAFTDNRDALRPRIDLNRLIRLMGV